MAINGDGASTVFDRMPPQDLEAERCVLGSMLLDNQCIPNVIDLVHEGDFFRLAHKRIYSAIVSLHLQEIGVDPVTLADELRRRGQLDEGDCAELDIPYIDSLFSGTPTAANAEYYSRIAKRKSLLRAMIHLGTAMVRSGYDETDTPEEIIAQAHNKLLELSTNNVRDSVSPVSEILAGVFDEIHHRQQDGASSRRIKTHFLDLDEQTGGFHRGELVFIAARPSIGKTTLAVNLTTNMATPGGAGVLFASLEQRAIELSERMLCAEARVSTHKVRTGRLSSQDIQTLMDATAEIARKPIFIDDTPTRTVFQIGMSARRIQMKHGLAMVVIDYLQLVSPDAEDRGHNRETQVASLSRNLKHLARSLDVPVVVLAQLNRESEKGADKRPKLHHLRESGAIEQDADVVILLSRDAKEDSQIVVDVAKQRNGRTGPIHLTLLKDFLRFENCATGYDSQSYYEPGANG